MFRDFVFGRCRLFFLTVILYALSLSSPAHSKQLQEKWTLNFSHTTNFSFLKSLRGTAEQMITGTAVLSADQSGNVSGSGTMSVTTHTHSPRVESSGGGTGTFTVKGTWSGDEIIFTFQGEVPISVTTKSLGPPPGTTTRTEKINSVMIASDQVIERKNGARAKAEAHYSGSKKGYLSKSFNLSGKRAFPTKTITTSTDLPTKKDIWTLELLSEFTYPTVSTKTEGHVTFSLPDGRAPFLSKGTATSIMYAGAGTKAEDVFLNTEGDLQIEGKPRKDSITFNAIYKARKSKQGNSFSEIMDPGEVHFSDDKVSMKLKNGAELVRDMPQGKITWRLKCQKTGVLVVSPSDGLKSSGPDKNGRFNPSSKTYTLKNAGKSSIDYNISKTKKWLDLSKTKGTLGPGASTTFKVSINENAKTLKKDDSDTVKLANLTNGQGNTSRQVKLLREQQWRVVFAGWNTLSFSDKILGGGLKVDWVVMVDFKIREGKYEAGKGRAYFRKLESHSHPPGVYDCVPLKGVYRGEKGNRYPTPYIANESFNVPGVKKGSWVSLELPGNFYVVGYHCVMNSDRAKEAFEGVGAIRAEDRVKMSRKEASIKDVRYLPSGNKKIPLREGLYKEFGHTKSIDAHRIWVHRVK